MSFNICEREISYCLIRSPSKNGARKQNCSKRPNLALLTHKGIFVEMSTCFMSSFVEIC